MRKIKNHNLAELLVQLKFTPPNQRQKQLDNSEKFLASIERDKEYTFEYVFYRITGYHTEPLPELLPIVGEELREDMRIFISRLSGQFSPPAVEQGEKVYTIGSLAKEFNVSTKTIDRWRKQGLNARKYIFEDGKKRLGFAQSAVDGFAESNPDIVVKAKQFNRLGERQKEEMIREARRLARKGGLSRYQIIEEVSQKFGRAHETVRYTILSYEGSNPDKVVFGNHGGVITASQASEIYRLYKQGTEIRVLMDRFGRSKSSIYRIINERRAKSICARKIEFIASEEFLRADAEEKILAMPIRGLHRPEVWDGMTPFGLSARSLPEYMRVLKSSPILTREDEESLFRRYNFLKYLACRARNELDGGRVLSSYLKKIESCLVEAEEIKKKIIEANLRLVVSIANKHSNSGANLMDLISEGNFSMMRAVEKFDYTRGVRFATYASWAISTEFARKIPAEARRPDKTGMGFVTDIERDLRQSDGAGVVVIERTRDNLIRVIENELNERERYIILNHFGLVGKGIRRERKTLKEIGEHLNLSKERIRQVELLALAKLRGSLSVKEFELLMD